MAVHASLGWWDSSKRKLLNGGMAVAAIDTIIAHMVLVTELDGLLAREESLGVIRRSIEFKQHPDKDGGEKDRAKDRRLGNEVGASIEDLPHRFLRAIEKWKQGAANASKLSFVATALLSPFGSSGEGPEARAHTRMW